MQKTLSLLALLSPMIVLGQVVENIWVCPGAEVSLTCPGDSLNWLLVQNGDTAALDLESEGILIGNDELIISTFSSTWFNQTLLGQSYALSDSGIIECGFLFHEFEIEPLLTLSVLPEEQLCNGELVEADVELPALPSADLSWVSVGVVDLGDSGSTVFSDSVIFELSADASIAVDVEAIGAYCPTFALTAEVDALPELLAPQIQASEEFLCFQNEGIEISISSEASGGQGSFVYTWQQLQQDNWENLGHEDTLFVAALPPGIYEFRCLATNDCGDVLSEVASVAVLEQVQAPVITSSSDSICFSNQGVNLSTIEGATGGNGEFEYFWDKLLLEEWVQVATGDIYDTGALVSGVHSYRLRANSSCGTTNSTVNDIWVFDEQIAPTIELVSSDTLCFSNEGALVNLLAPAQGGSPNSASFWVVSDENGISQFPDEAGDWVTDVLGVSTNIQYLNENECGVTLSNEIDIAVLEPFIGAEILSNVSSQDGVCNGSNFDVFEWDNSPSGGSEQFIVEWIALMDEAIIQSQSGGDSFMIQSAAEEDLEIRLSVVDTLGCGQSLSTLDVEVFDPIVAPMIYSPISDTVCAVNEGLEVFVGVSPGGGGEENLTWWNVEQEGETTQFSYEEAGAFTLEELESTLTVWLSNENVCADSQSDSLTFEVLPEMTAPVIATSQELFPLCFGQDSPPFYIVSSPLGATNEWSLEWVQETPSFEAVVDESLDSFSLPDQTVSSSLTLFAESVFGCGTVMSNVIDIPVLAALESGDLSSNQLICFGAEPDELSSTEFSGGSGDVEYAWHLISSGDTSIVTTPNGTYNLGPLIDSMAVVLEVIDSYGCGSVFSNQVAIDVLPALETPLIGLSDADTLCWQGGIGLSAVGFAAYPWLDLQWSSSPNQSAVTSGVGEYEIEVTQLDTSTVFSLTVSSSYGCGSVEAIPVEVPVFHELMAGTIGHDLQPEFESAFCFGDTLSQVYNVEPPQGGSMQWQVDWVVFNQVGQEIFVETASDSISPFFLNESIQIVRRTTDLLGCGSLLSNEIDIAVYDSLAWELSLEGIELCDNESFSEFTVSAVGGGETFEYQWQSTDAVLDLTEIAGGSLSGVVPNESASFWVQANSLNGCGEISSDTVDVFVAEALLPSTISAALEEICFGESVLIGTDENPSGGLGEFDLEWVQFDASGVPVDSGEMSPDITVVGEGNDIVGFQRATNSCGSVNSDTVFVVVNPTPAVPILSGNLEPCLGSTNQSYTISSGWWLGLEYDWSIQGGEITSGETGPNLLIDWDINPGLWGLQVELIFQETGCQSSHSFEINPSEEFSPPLTEVFKKLGQDILISADSSECAVYQWGAIDIASGEELIFSGQNAQYIILDTFDTESYHYFVDITYTCVEFGDCSTRNFYNHVPFVSIEENQNDAVNVFPNPTSGLVRFDGLKKSVQWKLFSTNGEIWTQGTIGPGRGLDFSHLSTGLYFLQIDGKVCRLQILK